MCKSFIWLIPLFILNNITNNNFTQNNSNLYFNNSSQNSNQEKYLFNYINDECIISNIGYKCYSCILNPCRSCQDSSAIGRFSYSVECCNFCGGCLFI